MIKNTWACLELDSYFHSCWEQVPETWTKGSSVNSLSSCVFGHTYSLANIQWPGLSNQQTLLLTENCLQCQKWSQRSGFCTHLCRKGEKWPTKALLPRQPPRVRHVMTLPTHLPHPTCSLVQNLSLKRILRQLITCGQSYMTSALVISGLMVNL